MQPIWDFLVHHRTEIVLAAVFAIIIDLMRIGSRTGTWVRHIKNWLSERSAAKMRRRIKLLEKQKAQYLSYATSDKALYLYTFKMLMLILALMNGSGFLIAIREMLMMTAGTAEFGRLMNFYVVMASLTALLVAIGGMKITSWDTRDKIMVEV